MPKTNKDVEDEVEFKGRRTRATAAVTDSPLRRTTRASKQTIKEDDSSPESVVSDAGPSRTRSRRTLTLESVPVEPQTRMLRPRKTSTTSDVSEAPESEPSVESKKRTTRRSLATPAAPETPTKARLRRATRAGSESKTMSPVVRVTRRTRASSVDPDPPEERFDTAPSTPLRTRRQRASVLPSEPSVMEEVEKLKPVDDANDDVFVLETSHPVDAPDKTPQQDVVQSATPKTPKEVDVVRKSPRLSVSSQQTPDRQKLMETADDNNSKDFPKVLIEKTLTDKPDISPGNKENEKTPRLAGRPQKVLKVAVSRPSDRRSLNPTVLESLDVGSRFNISLDSVVLKTKSLSPARKANLEPLEILSSNDSKESKGEGSIIFIDDTDTDEADRPGEVKGAKTSRQSQNEDEIIIASIADDDISPCKSQYRKNGRESPPVASQENYENPKVFESSPSKPEEYVESNDSKLIEIESDSTDGNIKALFRDIPAKDWQQGTSACPVDVDDDKGESDGELDLVLVGKGGWSGDENESQDKTKDPLKEFNYESDDTIIVTKKAEEPADEQMDVTEIDERIPVSSTEGKSKKSHRKSLRRSKTGESDSEISPEVEEQLNRSRDLIYGFESGIPFAESMEVDIADDEPETTLDQSDFGKILRSSKKTPLGKAAKTPDTGSDESKKSTTPKAPLNRHLEFSSDEGELDENEPANSPRKSFPKNSEEVPSKIRKSLSRKSLTKSPEVEQPEVESRRSLSRKSEVSQSDLQDSATSRKSLANKLDESKSDLDESLPKARKSLSRRSAASDPEPDLEKSRKSLPRRSLPESKIPENSEPTTDPSKLEIAESPNKSRRSLSTKTEDLEKSRKSISRRSLDSKISESENSLSGILEKSDEVSKSESSEDPPMSAQEVTLQEQVSREPKETAEDLDDENSKENSEGSSEDEDPKDVSRRLSTRKSDANVKKSEEVQMEISQEIGEKTSDEDLDVAKSSERRRSTNRVIQKSPKKLETSDSSKVKSSSRKSSIGTKAQNDETKSDESLVLNLESEDKSSEDEEPADITRGLKKRKSMNTSLGKLNKSGRNSSGAQEDADEKSEKKLGKSLQKSLSTIVQINSEADVGAFSDDSDVEQSQTVSSFFYGNADSSDSDGDSDVQKEYNLNGDDIAYSDDDVPGDDCRASESEESESDEEDEDLGDFIVNTDEEDEDEEEEDEDEDESDGDENEGDDVGEDQAGVEVDDDQAEVEVGEDQSEVEDQDEDQSEVEDEDQYEDQDEDQDEDQEHDEDHDEDQDGDEDEDLTAEITDKMDDSDEIMQTSELSQSVTSGKPSSSKLPSPSPKKSRKSLTSEITSPMVKSLLHSFKTPSKPEDTSKQSQSSKKSRKSLNITPTEASPSESSKKVRKLSVSEKTNMETDSPASAKKSKENSNIEVSPETPKLKQDHQKQSESVKKGKRSSISEKNQSLEVTESPRIAKKKSKSNMNKTMALEDSVLVDTRLLMKEKLNDSLPILSKGVSGRKSELGIVLEGAKEKKEEKEMRKKSRKATDEDILQEISQNLEGSKKSKKLDSLKRKCSSVKDVASQDSPKLKKNRGDKYLKLVNSDSDSDEEISQGKNLKKKSSKISPKVGLAKASVKRLPEEFLENLPDVPQRPKKKRKINHDVFLPSRSMFDDGTMPRTMSIDDEFVPISRSGGTTNFEVISLKKSKDKRTTPRSFRERMMNRVPRQNMSAFAAYNMKLQASGKNKY